MENKGWLQRAVERGTAQNELRSHDMYNSRDIFAPRRRGDVQEKIPMNMAAWVVFCDLLLDRQWFAKYWDSQFVYHGPKNSGKVYAVLETRKSLLYTPP